MKKSMWKKLMSTILALVMVLGLSGTLGFQHVDATENSGFTFLPDKTEVKRGDIVTYSIDLAKNAKIAGITAQFTFDPDVLEAVGDGVDAKGYVKNAVKKGNVSEGTFGDFYVNTDGRIGIVAILNDNDKDKLADGNVAKISFKVKDTAKGDIGLKVKNLEFCDVNSEDIPTSEISVTKDNDAQIKVVVLATGITVDKTATTIVKGATDKLTATLVPADANGTITWSTSDSSVATVSSDGTVTAVKNGTATVTAKCGDLSAQTKVTVINPLKAITITGTTHSIKKGQTTQLGLTYDPADTTDSVAATWTSSNTSVATVSKTGLVTALKDGSTTIKATVGNVSSTYDIAVKEVKLTGIKMEEKALIHKGDTKALTVEYTPADTTDDKTVAWSSSDSTVASVDNNGIVTAVKPGSAVITAKVGNYQATCAVTVDAPLKEIVPEKAIIDMVKKQTANIAYSVVPADTTDSKDVTYTSSDETVATVNSDGKVTAKKAGQATVTITGANGIKATVTVNVSEIPVNEVVLSAQDEIIEAGAKKAITATLKPENNTDDNQGVTWTTSDEKIAKVYDGVIVAGEVGTAEITATTSNGKTAKCTVTVTEDKQLITNDRFYTDTDGNILYSQGGGIFIFPNDDKYYWYGVRYKEAVTYATDPLLGKTVEHPAFEAYTCYTSDDLVNWKYEGDVATLETLGQSWCGWAGRCGVVYNEKANKYVLVSQINGTIIASADNPKGPFKTEKGYFWGGTSLPVIANGDTGDLTMFYDEDSKGYMICSSANGRGHIYIAPMDETKNFCDFDFDNIKELNGSTGSYFDEDGTIKQKDKGGIEGDCMFKYKDHYYFTGSDLYGWRGSRVYVFESKDILGDYKLKPDYIDTSKSSSNLPYIMPGAKYSYAHNSQTGFYYTLHGSKQDTVIYCGDRWCDFGTHGIGYNQWVPLTMDGYTPHFNDLSQWKLNSETGEWTIGDGNNYIANNEFDADRVDVKSLTGWECSDSTDGSVNGNVKARRFYGN